MNVARVVTVNLILGSMAAAGLLGLMRGISYTLGSHSADGPDTGSKNADSDQATQPNANTATAIAEPETLPGQQLTTLAAEASITGLAPALTQPQTKSAQAKQSAQAKKSLPGVQVARNVRSPYDQTLPINQPILPATLGTIAPPEIIPGGLLPNQDATLIPLEVSLKDIQGHWAQYYIEFLVERNIVRGFPNGTFRPDRRVTQAEFDTLVQQATLNQGIAPVSYRELQSRKPGQPVTRAEAAAFIYRAIVRSDVVESVTSVQINGEVLRPGRYSLAAASDERLGKGNNLPTLSRAIQQAGGALASADLRQVEIHRLTDTGEPKVIKVDVWRVREAGNLAQDVVIQQDDKIVIPAIAAAAPVRAPLTAHRELRSVPGQVEPSNTSFRQSSNTAFRLGQPIDSLRSPAEVPAPKPAAIKPLLPAEINAGKPAAASTATNN